MVLSAQELVRTLNELFGRFDRLAEVGMRPTAWKTVSLSLSCFFRPPKKHPTVRSCYPELSKKFIKFNQSMFHLRVCVCVSLCVSV